MRVKVKVQVKPYIRQYLYNCYGCDQVEIRSNSCDPITSKIYDVLSRSERFYRYELGEEYSESFTFILNGWTNKLAGLEITPDKIISFNYYVDQIIKERLFIILDTLQLYQKIKIKSVINNYIDHNNLCEVGLNYEMLKKAYYRYRLHKINQSWHIPTDNLVPKNPKRAA